jgi:hypothetical protein
MLREVNLHSVSDATGSGMAGLEVSTEGEGRISTLKRSHGLDRCRYRGPEGMQRWVGPGVVADDLEVLGHTPPCSGLIQAGHPETLNPTLAAAGY